MTDQAETSIAFDRAAAYYDQTRTLSAEDSHKLTEALVRETGAGPETRFLEIGIGTGRIAGPLSERGLRITGIDLARPMLEVLRRKYGQVPVVEGDMTRLPFAGRSFDVVLAFHVLHLVPNWADALRETARVLRPGGQFVYSYHWRAPDSNNLQMRDHWRALLHSRGLKGDRPGTRDLGQISAVLEELGARARAVDVVSGSQPVTIRQVLSNMERRIWSDTWRIPDDVFPEVMAEMRAWAGARFDLDAVEQEEFRIVLHIFRW